jgi:hypothetical protein
MKKYEDKSEKGGILLVVCVCVCVFLADTFGKHDDD